MQYFKDPRPVPEVQFCRVHHVHLYAGDIEQSQEGMAEVRPPVESACLRVFLQIADKFCFNSSVFP